MAYRSEQNRIGNKQHFKDLNLTHYPTTLDTRINNTNMRGFINVGEGEIPDYVMAEFVNAALDGVMALERTLGRTPMVPFDASVESTSNIIENKTVDDRLTRIEDGLFDERYGGKGWKYVANRPTLNSHNHDGENGHPGRIHLVNEVTNFLQKNNLNLKLSDGLKGSDIYVSHQDPRFISEAIDDSLSLSIGGTVLGDTYFYGGFRSRTHADIDASELPTRTNLSRRTNNQAFGGSELYAGATTSAVTLADLNQAVKGHMMYGKFSVVMRLRTNVPEDTNAVRARIGNQSQLFTGENIGSGYKQVHFVFDQDDTNINESLIIEKIATTDNRYVALDSVLIEPMHPATLDR